MLLSPPRASLVPADRRAASQASLCRSDLLAPSRACYACRVEITLQRATDFLFELREARPTCTNCTHWTYRAAYENKVEIGREPYWHHDIIADVVTQRCNTCLLKPLYPWTTTLTAERLLTWLLANPPSPGEHVKLDRLHDDLTSDRGGFRFL
jgi:hypothetical protein